jgi:hypothetical protein
MAIKNSIIIARIITIFLNFALSAQTPIDEDALFSSDSGMIVDSSSMLDNAAIKEENDKKSIGFSGALTSAGTAAVSRDWFDGFHRTDGSVGTGIHANAMVDIRLLQGLKAFANLEIGHIPSTGQNLIALREIFIDFNIRHRAYFRTGKQVLQWGRCYFWNPTDLINVEKKLFIQKIGYREGAYGLKVHVPYKTLFNIYGFLDTKNAAEFDNLAAAGKIEFLIRTTEMAFEIWGKHTSNPVFGYDISTNFFGISLNGEFSISHGDNTYRLITVRDTMLVKYKVDNIWTPRLCIGVTKMFDVLNYSNRLALTGEFYYNYRGYDENSFNDPKDDYLFTEPVIASTSGFPNPPQWHGTKTAFLEGHNLYEMHNYSKYYAAFFTSFSRFIVSDMTLIVNGIMNLAHHCAILSAGVQYRNINDFNLGFTVYGFAGPKNTEYTYTNAALSMQLTAGIVF